MNPKLVAAGIVAAAAVIGVGSSLFVVDESHQAIVTQFGNPVSVIQDPGAHFKLPFIQDVVYMERRVLDLDPQVEQVILADQRRLQVDAFARYRIADPLAFYKSVGGGSDFRTMETILQRRLVPQLEAALRSVLGNVNLVQLLSAKRTEVMEQIRHEMTTQGVAFGIEVVDVRIRRADLPDQTSQAIYARMQSERQREAAENRAQGQEAAQQIRSRAERDRTVLLAEAQRDADILRGEGDREATRILAEAHDKAPEFYAFYRSLQAYRTAMADQKTTLVLSPKSQFFRYFEQLDPVLSGPSDPADSPPVAGLPTPGELPVPTDAPIPPDRGESITPVPAQ
ncbi:protease modulator HflC [Radicibacter daui]|uniref:protease modulator HflC n=1 Tax=Radicibacter daui TaxID=3064829 RepID=UPI004046DF25